MSKKEYTLIDEEIGKISVHYDSRVPEYTYIKNKRSDRQINIDPSQIDDVIDVLTKLKEQL